MGDWLTILLGQSWTGTDAEQVQAMKLREMAMPPGIKASGNRRLLRDAILARALLSDASTGRDGTAHQVLERIRVKENARLEANARVVELQKKMKPEDIEWAKAAAEQLILFRLGQKKRR